MSTLNDCTPLNLGDMSLSELTDEIASVERELCDLERGLCAGAKGLGEFIILMLKDDLQDLRAELARRLTV